jgi:Sugar (and other) transporter
MTDISAYPHPAHAMSDDRIDRAQMQVIVTSSLGTVFEWYDFFLYASLSQVIAAEFFSGLNPTAAFIFSLLAFSAGFVVRPFGALVFGRLGDLVGRKHTFLVTILLMGISTFVVGLIPAYATIGIAAPALLITLRLVQGLAVGGEYGGAVVYVAEHAPDRRRGFYTSFIQITPALGLLLSLIVIAGARGLMSTGTFSAQGWRIPFLLSFVLLAISVWIRLRMHESPVFLKIKEEGRRSPAPLREAFGSWKYLSLSLLALFGGVAGQAVVWQTAQLYTLFFLSQTLGVDTTTTNVLVGAMLLVAIPFFVIFGWLSDRIGRKTLISTGCLLAALTYFPLFDALARYANPDLITAQDTSPVTLISRPGDCSFQFNPIGAARFTSSCDIAKSFLARNGISYSNKTGLDAVMATIQIGSETVNSVDVTGGGPIAAERLAGFTAAATRAIRDHGYPAAADPAKMNRPMMLVVLVILVIYGTMVYGPIAAQLVELFPTRIRYSAISLPYHIGNGWFGGLLPTIAFAIVAATGNMYSGLWYPIVVAGLTFVVSVLFMPETRDRSLAE